MARVAVLVSNPCTIDARVLKMARGARDAGHEVHVFGTLSADTVPYQTVDGITFHRLEWRPAQIIVDNSPMRLWGKKGRPLAIRIARKFVPFLKYRLFSHVFGKHVVNLKPDIIHAHDLICLRAGMEAAEACGAKVVYDAHELEVHRNPPLPRLQKWYVGKVEKQYGSKAAAVITVGRKIAEILGEELGRKDVNVLFNSPPVETCPRHVRSDLALPETTPLVVYVGKVAVGRGVSEILSLLRNLKGVVFATVGPCDAVQREALMTQASEQGVSARFRILPPVPFEQVVDYIAGADAGVISVEPITLSYRYCMPNKLFELSFADVPIISNQLDEIEEFLAENGNGIIVDFENQTDLVYSIFRLFNEKQTYRFNGARRAHLEKNYSWSAQAEKLVKIYDHILPADKKAVAPKVSA